MSDHDVLLEAIVTKDIEKLRRLVDSGVNINAVDDYGCPLLHRIELVAGSKQRVAMESINLLSMFVDLGADIHALADDGASVLIGPILDQDLDTLKWFLDRGVDPNRGCSEPWESVYDFAKFDYGFETDIGWGISRAEPSSTELSDEDAWLLFLDREAQGRGCRRPDYLFLLRERGALSGREIARQLGGTGSSGIRWEADGWRLTDDEPPVD